MSTGLLLLGFGAPDNVEGVWPFLERIAAGRGIPVERLRSVATHYEHLGGSPLNAQNQAILDGVVERLATRGIEIPAVLGNRNTPPFVDEALATLHAQGADEVLAFFATPWSSYSSCRQYREDLGGATSALPVKHIKPYADLTGIVAANVAVIRETVGESHPYVLFTTHSLPLGDTDRYVGQQLEICAAVARELGVERWQLVYQSRSGRPDQPWLAPDVNDALRELAAQGIDDVLLVPVGFLSEHMEVLWDLDHEAVATAAELDMTLHRAPTIGDRPEFLDALADRIATALSTGSSGCAGLCGATCCPNPRGNAPASEGI